MYATEMGQYWFYIRQNPVFALFFYKTARLGIEIDLQSKYFINKMFLEYLFT